MTICCHADVDRIGDRTLLLPLALGKRVALSRLSPGFRHPSSDGTPVPLVDPAISRNAHRLDPLADGGVRLIVEPHATPLRLDGERLAAGEIGLDRARLLRGAVLELGERVALLLQLLPPEEWRGPTLGWVGHHHSLEQLRADAVEVARGSQPVLIRGAVGTGKAMIARTLHALSSRVRDPFVRASLGGDRRLDHLLDHSGCGTLLLERVAAATAQRQQELAKLLAQQPRARVILSSRATDDGAVALQLRACIARSLHLLPLRERREDIPRLFVAFLREALHARGERRPLTPSDPRAHGIIAAPVMLRLLSHAFPGNVAELRRVVAVLVDSMGADRRVRVDALDSALAAPAASAAG
jgi:hypothetical protein